MTSGLNVLPPQRELIVDLLRQFVPGVEVWAFGSRVKDAARDSSDLDMVLFSDSSRRAQVSALREAFEESSLPFRVDLHVWEEIPDNFRNNIRAAFCVLQEKK